MMPVSMMSSTMITFLSLIGSDKSFIIFTSAARFRACAVAGHCDKINLDVALDFSHEVCKKDACASQSANQRNGFALVIFADLFAEFGNSFCDFFTRYENFFDFFAVHF